MDEFKLFINNEFVDGEKIIKILSPYNGTEIGNVHFAGRKQMESALCGAIKAFNISKELSVYERTEILQQLLAGIKEHSELFTSIIVQEGGKPVKFAKNEVLRGQITIKSAIEVINTLKGEILPLDISPQTKGYSGFVKRFPIGPVLAIAPFNFPLNLVLHKLAPAIATGNPIIIKPASQTPITSLLIANILRKISMPKGFVNILPIKGKDAEYLITDNRIKKISFTGSPEIGWHLKQLAYNKKVTLELGGNAAAIVAADANINEIIPRLALGAMAHSGQVCISVQRIFIEETIFNSFVEKFTDYVKKNIKYGSPENEETIMGPMINNEAIVKIDNWVKEAKKAGAKILTGGKIKNNFYLPTVIINSTPKMKINSEEVFAPVVTLTPFTSIEDAIDKVNNSKFGLQAAIFTNRQNWINKAYQKIETGGIIANDYPTFRIDPMPYGGVKNSGFGKEGLQYAIEEMTDQKLLVIKN